MYVIVILLNHNNILLFENNCQRYTLVAIFAYKNIYLDVYNYLNI